MSISSVSIVAGPELRAIDGAFRERHLGVNREGPSAALSSYREMRRSADGQALRIEREFASHSGTLAGSLGEQLNASAQGLEQLGKILF